MKKILLISMLALLSWSVNSQTVTIPDAHFVTWLQNNYPTCMNGNQMDTTCTDIVTATSVFLGHHCIADLSGIQYFTSLTQLDCSYNLITNIPALPSNLWYFSCDSNLLASLPPLPNTLSELNCRLNQFTSLPTLPPSLITLICDANFIDTIASLPSTLVYLSCSQNQLTSIGALDTSLVELVCFGNSLTTLPPLDSALARLSCGMNHLNGLPALPRGLTSLTCYSNQIAVLPALDSSLTYLDCNSNLLTNLPALPNRLNSLNCSNNLLGTLPTLTDSIVMINCSSNSLAMLPTLPLYLNSLDCSNNNLSSLPTLPNMLTQITCDNNVLSVFPAMPASLYSISCRSNQLSTLPALGSGLTTLYCDHNILSTFPAFSSSLNYLSCDYNSLTTFPAFGSSLSYFSCTNNQLGLLPAFSNSMSEVHLSNNQLTVLPPLSSSLSRLYCNDNPLVTLPTLPNSLNELDCQNTSLTGLPSLPGALYALWCGNNNINCFPVFPFSLTDSLNFGITPNPFTCLPNYIPAMTWATLARPLCGAGNVSGCASSLGIVGFVYNDSISNCVKDTTDRIYVNVPLKCYGTNNNLLSQTFTAVNGVYDFPESSGMYTVKIDTANVPYTYQCASPGLDTTLLLSPLNSLVQGVNFDIVCKPGFDVGTRSIMSMGLPFPGETHVLKIMAGDMSHWYNMHCAGGMSGQVQITINGPVSYTGVTPGALVPTVSGNVLTYPISNFDLVHNSTDFGLVLTTATLAQNGDQICVNVAVSPSGGDNDTSNNSFDYCYYVVNSHDPNVKQTCPDTVGERYQDYFTYTIHFQNTGTAPALNIRLLDTLDAKLDLTTFELMNYSHTNVASLTGRLLTFNFHNINLPDSTSDSEGSIGYVQYRIKPIANLLYGTTILNKADIYFDFNPPVTTNTSVNRFMRVPPPVTVNIDEHKSNAFSIYPNPATEHITINYPSASKNFMVTLYDVLGSVVKSVNCKNAVTTISVGDLASGVYFIKVADGTNTSVQRMVKE